MSIPQLLLADFDVWSTSIPVPAALAAVALIGYLFGTRTRQAPTAETEQARRELRRARHVASELEKIADTVRRDLASHRSSVSRFKKRVGELAEDETDHSWKELCQEAEDMLKPTLELATKISLAYDEIRQQSAQLMSFTEVRTDPLTGVCNRRALDETLDNYFALLGRYGQAFTVAIFDIDHFKKVNDDRGHMHGDRILQRFARLLDDTVRDTDLVARYGGEEFVVVMPHTDLQAAGIFAERVRKLVKEQLPITTSGGLAQAREDDTAQSLITRADAALYSAKGAGRDAIFRHDGVDIEPLSRFESDMSSIYSESAAC